MKTLQETTTAILNFLAVEEFPTPLLFSKEIQNVPQLSDWVSVCPNEQLLNDEFWRCTTPQILIGDVLEKMGIKLLNTKYNSNLYHSEKLVNLWMSCNPKKSLNEIFKGKIETVQKHSYMLGTSHLHTIERFKHKPTQDLHDFLFNLFKDELENLTPTQ